MSAPPTPEEQVQVTSGLLESQQIPVPAPVPRRSYAEAIASGSARPAARVPVARVPAQAGPPPSDTRGVRLAAPVTRSAACQNHDAAPAAPAAAPVVRRVVQAANTGQAPCATGPSGLNSAPAHATGLARSDPALEEIAKAIEAEPEELQATYAWYSSANGRASDQPGRTKHLNPPQLEQLEERLRR